MNVEILSKIYVQNIISFALGVIYPVVPKRVIMLRVIPTAAHTLEDVKETIDAFKEVKKKLDEGIYQKMGEKGAVLT